MANSPLAPVTGQPTAAPDGPAIEVRDLHKHYPGTPEGTGLAGVDLTVEPGTVFGLLGPNGAGKTTAVRVLATLLRFDRGIVRVAGWDVRTQPHQVRRRIGLVGQGAAVDEILSARQNLLLFARLSGIGAHAAPARIDELLSRFALGEAADRPVSTFSGGMRRRLDLAASLLVAPPVLFVDEPTTGLDPQGRREVWGAIGDLVRDGTTVLLTTQYLEEADALADRVAVLHAGRVVAEGSPEELKAASGGDRLDLAFATADEARAARPIAERFAAATIEVDEEGGTLNIPVRERTRALVGLATALADANLEPVDLTVRRPTLDEAFLRLTGVSR